MIINIVVIFICNKKNAFVQILDIFSLFLKFYLVSQTVVVFFNIPFINIYFLFRNININKKELLALFYCCLKAQLFLLLTLR